MAEQSSIFDANEKNFDALVIENSTLGPVLVNYWAAYADPCSKLWPELEKLTQEYNGHFLLVNVNTEKQRALADRLGINSVPTIKMYRHKQIVDTVHGAKSERSLRALIEKYITREPDAVLRDAMRIYQAGDIETAMHKLREAAEADPFNLRIPLTLAKLLMRHQQYEHAEQLLSSLPDEVRDEREIASLLAHLGFMQAMQIAPPREELEATVKNSPDDHAARHQLTAVLLSSDDYELAILQLLELLRRDRYYKDEVARKGLTAIFDMLGGEHELVVKHREQMINLMF